MTIGSVSITLDLDGIDKLLGAIGKQNTVTTTQNPIQNSVSVAVADPTATTTIAGVEASDAASITVYGRTGRQIVTILANQTQAGILAEYLVRPAPEYWFSSIEVLLNGLSSGDRDTVAELDIGDQIQVSKRFPNVTNPVVQDLFVEGIEHDITVDRHVVRLYCSPASLYELFRLNGYINTVTRTNLSTNPSFETNNTYAASVGGGVTISRITTDAFVGSACGQVVHNSTSNVGIIGPQASVRIPVVAGDVLAASCYVKNTVGSRSLRVSVQYYANNSTNTVLQSTAGTAVTNPTSWTRVQVLSAPAPSGALFAALLIGPSTTGSTGDTWLVDGVLVEKNQPIGQPYFDGGTADTWTGYTNLTTSWTGTTNNSTSTSLWGVGSTPDSVLDSPAVGLG
jgi:hypothetical protein